MTGFENSGGSTDAASRHRASGGTGFRVIEADAQADPRWKELVCTHPDGLVYHHPDYLATLEAAYGYELMPLACEDTDGRLVGLLPLAWTRTPVGGTRLSSLPHTPVGGPLGNEDAQVLLAKAALARVRQRRRSRLELKLPSDTLGEVPGLVGSPGDSTYVLGLPDSPERLRFGNSRNHARIRSAVNKAGKAGVAVRAAETTEDLRRWYRLYLQTMQFHAVPPRPYRFFIAAWQRLRPAGLLRLLLAEQHSPGGARMLAGSVLLMSGQTIFYAYNARDEGALALGPNYVIQWRAIHDAVEEGYRRYDLGEVTAHQRGLAHFKSKWGAEPGRLHRYHYPAPSGRGDGPLAAGRPLRELAEAAWRRLPLGTTARLGDLLYRVL